MSDKFNPEEDIPIVIAIMLWFLFGLALGIWIAI